MDFYGGVTAAKDDNGLRRRRGTSASGQQTRTTDVPPAQFLRKVSISPYLY